MSLLEAGTQDKTMYKLLLNKCHTRTSRGTSVHLCHIIYTDFETSSHKEKYLRMNQYDNIA